LTKCAKNDKDISKRNREKKAKDLDPKKWESALTARFGPMSPPGTNCDYAKSLVQNQTVITEEGGGEERKTKGGVNSLGGGK